ncbi:MAG TPA: type II 3-dehydroquinate dehydratase [Gemmatimonadales bacterium]|nr:type II 3-dehydroquinate dehydratase [Gemmatimonadales bacterium]
MRVAVLNGPNLNLLGRREPELYGRGTFAELEAAVRVEAATLGLELDWHQSNHEGELVELVQRWPGRVDGALINAAAYTHTSLALRDALLAVRLPFVEVHLSNIFAREPARRHSLLADLALGVIAGLGPRGYGLALHALAAHLRERAGLAERDARAGRGG